MFAVVGREEQRIVAVAEAGAAVARSGSCSVGVGDVVAEISNCSIVYIDQKKTPHYAILIQTQLKS